MSRDVAGSARLVPVPAGTFRMGSDRHYPEERPAHEQRVAAFAIGSHPVTNAEFAAFVQDTGYRSLAERPFPTPGHPDRLQEPGSVVFVRPAHRVDLRDWRQWWAWRPAASWRQPEGAGSTIDDRMDHPVVHIARPDAMAYAHWAGCRLPTETEWEAAARGGLDGAEYAWGDELFPDGRRLANIWFGDFPVDSTGWCGTSPVGSFPPNAFGLFDMIGNVWEWTATPYTGDHRPALPSAARLPLADQQQSFVVKGGSFLCAANYCRRYRPAARSPQAADSGTSHIGFRCAADVPRLPPAPPQQQGVPQ